MKKRIKRNKDKSVKKGKGWIFWTPRILSILFICFLFLFSFDVFGEGQGFWMTALAFFMHNIPVLILLVVLLISWKYEIVGGVAFILAGLAYMLWKNFELFSYLIIVGTTFFIGILFLIEWFRKRKKN